MREKTIDEISQIYDLELDKVVENIKKQKAKKVLLQFPEGLKPYALAVSSYIEEQTGCLCLIWIDTCFGACDAPVEADKFVDLTVQFGHSKWGFKDKKIEVL